MVLSKERKAQMLVISKARYAERPIDINRARLEKRIREGTVPSVKSLAKYHISIEEANELAGKRIFEDHPDGGLIRLADPVIKKPRAKSIRTQTAAGPSVNAQTRSTQTVAEPIPTQTTQTTRRVAAEPISTQTGPEPEADHWDSDDDELPLDAVYTRAIFFGQANDYRGTKFNANSKKSHLSAVKKVFDHLKFNDSHDIIPLYKNYQDTYTRLSKVITKKKKVPTQNTLAAWMSAMGTWIQGDNPPLPDLAARLTPEEIARFGVNVDNTRATAEKVDVDTFDWKTVIEPALKKAFQSAKNPGFKLWLWILMGNVKGMPRLDASLPAVAVKTKDSRPELDVVYSLQDKTIYVRKHKTSNNYDVHYSLAGAGDLLSYIKDDTPLFPTTSPKMLKEAMGGLYIYGSVRTSFESMVSKMKAGPRKDEYLLAMATVTAHSQKTSQAQYVSKKPVTAKDLRNRASGSQPKKRRST
jgi:hypothetical protein